MYNIWDSGVKSGIMTPYICLYCGGMRRRMEMLPCVVFKFNYKMSAQTDCAKQGVAQTTARDASFSDIQGNLFDKMYGLKAY